MENDGEEMVRLLQGQYAIDYTCVFLYSCMK